MRTFVRLRSLMDSNSELAKKIHSLEKKYDERFKIVFEAIGKLLDSSMEDKKPTKRRVEVKDRFPLLDDPLRNVPSPDS